MVILTRNPAEWLAGYSRPQLTFSVVLVVFRPDELMNLRLTWLLLSCSLIFLAGCTRLTNLVTFNGVSEIPHLTEPDLDDE